MIRYIQHKEIDKIKWDQCISSADGLIYAFSWYLDIVSPEWDALIEDDYVSAFPLTWRKKTGIHYLHQPFFTQQLGLFSSNAINKNKVAEFIKHIPSKFKLIEIQLNNKNEFDDSSAHKRITHHLDLTNPIEHIRRNYSDNLKRNIKKAEKNSLLISNAGDFRQIIKMFRENRGKDIENLRDNDYLVLEKLLDESIKKNILTCLTVNTNHGHLIAGAVFLQSMQSYIFLFSAINDEGREKGAMSLLIDSFINSHSGKSGILDFEGSMDPDLARFYKSFGSQEIVYLQIRKNKLPLLIRWLK